MKHKKKNPRKDIHLQQLKIKYYFNLFKYIYFNTIKNKKVKFPIHYQHNQNKKNNKNTKNDVSISQSQSPLENNDELDMFFQIDDIDIFQNDADDFDFFDFSQI